MPSTSFIEGLARIRGLTAPARALIEHLGERIEPLAIRIATKGIDDLSKAEKAEFKSLYNQYASQAIANRKAAIEMGTDAKKALSPEEIRKGFFHDLLGHVATTESQKLALRTSIIEASIETTGKLKLKDGSVLDLADVASIKKMKSMGMAVNESRLAMINEAEQATRDFATSRATRVETKDTAKIAERTNSAEAERVARDQRAQQTREAAERQAAAEAGARPSNIKGVTVAEMEKYGKTMDPKEARGLFKSDTEYAQWLKVRNHMIADDLAQGVQEAANVLEITFKSGLSIPTASTFANLRNLLRDPAMELVQSRHVANGAAILADSGKVTAEQTLKKLSNLEPVTDAELSGLQVFFRHFDDAKRNQQVPQNAMPTSMPMFGSASAKPAAIFTREALSEARNALRNAMSTESGTVPWAVRQEYVTGDVPGRLTTFVNTKPIISGLAGLTLTTALGVGGLGLTGYASPENAGRSTAFSFDALYWMDPVVKGQHDLTTYQYNGYMAGNGVNQNFIDATKKYSGITITQDTDLNPEKLYEISVGLQEGPKQNNVRDFNAYLFAIASKSGLPLPATIDEKADTKSFITQLVQHNEVAATNYAGNSLIRGNGTTPEFVAATDKFAGIDLVKDGKVTELTPEILYIIASSMQSRGVGNSNNREVAGFVQALAAKSFINKDDLDKARADTPDKGNSGLIAKIVEKTRDAYTQSIANNMVTDPALKDKKLTEFYGRADLTQIELAKGFAASTNQDPILRGAIGYYLVHQKIVKPEELTAEGSKGLNQRLIQAEADTEASTREKIEQDAARMSNQTADRLADERNRRYNQGESARPAPPTAERPSRERVTSMFNKMAGDTDFPELKGQAAKLAEIYVNSKDATEFERKLAQESPKIPKPTVQMLREMAYGQ